MGSTIRQYIAGTLSSDQKIPITVFRNAHYYSNAVSILVPAISLANTCLAELQLGDLQSDPQGYMKRVFVKIRLTVAEEFARCARITRAHSNDWARP